MSALRIKSQAGAVFADRREAGALLASELESLCDEQPVVLGVPRGGVIVADEIAGRLGAQLDIILAHKLPAPSHPEFAIGAVTESGKVFLHDDSVSQTGATQQYLEMVTRQQHQELQARAKRYRAVRPKVPLAGRSVIVVDDGVATGATLLAAIWAARQEGPERLIAALPVGPRDSLRRLADQADELVVLQSPPRFSAVGQFYLEFGQVEDDQLLAILASTAEDES